MNTMIVIDRHPVEQDLFLVLSMVMQTWLHLCLLIFNSGSNPAAPMRSCVLESAE